MEWSNASTGNSRRHSSRTTPPMLGRSPAHGSTWNQCDRQRGSPVLTCRARLWRTSETTRRASNIGQRQLADRLREQMQDLKSSRPRLEHQQLSYIPKDLATTPEVFIWVDSNKPPLHPPYEGPFDVQERHQKEQTQFQSTGSSQHFFSRHQYRLPPTQLRTSLATRPTINPATPPAKLQTRSGRRVHRPKRFTDYVAQSCTNLSFLLKPATFSF